MSAVRGSLRELDALCFSITIQQCHGGVYNPSLESRSVVTVSGGLIVSFRMDEFSGLLPAKGSIYSAVGWPQHRWTLCTQGQAEAIDQPASLHRGQFQG